MELILASASPRRREILENAGYDFRVCVKEIDESAYWSGQAEETVLRLSLAKAQAVAQEHPDDVVLGSDTVVALDGCILGKPKTEQQAFAMLKMLSGHSHYVYTGVSAVKGEKHESVVKRTEVFFYSLTDGEIQNYITTGEPFDKAGGYGIQSMGCVFIEKIIGDYFTVMGLPVAETARLLKRFGIRGKVIG